MGKGFTFNFFDRSKDTGIRYLATYDTDLSIDIICETYERSMSRGIRLPQVEKLGKAVDPWIVFYEHATFDSILRGLSLYSVRTRQDTRNETNDDYLHTWKATGVMDSGIPILTDSHAAFLKGIADNPDRLLYNNEALYRFVKLLWAAKTGVIPPHIKETKEEIKKMLIQNLVPKHRGGRKSLPQGTEAARKLLKLLADHIAEKCENLIKVSGRYADADDAFGPMWDDNFDYLIKCCESQEPRIIYLSKREMKHLVQYPRDYADAILENAVSVSLSTLNHSAK